MHYFFQRKQYFITDNSGLQYVTLWVMHLERSGKMSTIRRWSITVRLICGAGHEAIIITTSHFDWEHVSVSDYASPFPPLNKKFINKVIATSCNSDFFSRDINSQL